MTSEGFLATLFLCSVGRSDPEVEVMAVVADLLAATLARMLSFKAETASFPMVLRN